jgi:hypothetical protein
VRWRRRRAPRGIQVGDRVTLTGTVVDIGAAYLGSSVIKARILINHPTYDGTMHLDVDLAWLEGLGGEAP